MAAEKEVVASVWTRPRRSREQPALSRAQIVTEAVKLLDEQGLDALSMRSLGNRLNAGATSLYRHVANKDELIELVVDEVYGELRLPEEAGDWQATAIRSAHGVREMILRHPWFASLVGQAGLLYLGPNVMRLTDHLLVVFEGAGFSLEEADLAISTVMAYVIGMGISEAAWLMTISRSGQSEQELESQLRVAAAEFTSEHPRLNEILGKDAPEPEQARRDGFQYGLERILEGLALRLP